jgi:alpha-tubulin suppressor-like RCC1 family protein
MCVHICVGRVYAWGGGYKDSRRGGVPPVLGLGHTEARSSPEKIPAFDNVKIADIASGWDHCMARDVNGALYTWGSGQNGNTDRILISKNEY